MILKTFNENDQSEKVVYTHVLTKGLNKEENYGIIITSIMKNFLCCNKGNNELCVLILKKHAEIISFVARQ